MLFVTSGTTYVIIEFVNIDMYTYKYIHTFLFIKKKCICFGYILCGTLSKHTKVNKKKSSLIVLIIIILTFGKNQSFSTTEYYFLLSRVFHRS